MRSRATKLVSLRSPADAAASVYFRSTSAQWLCSLLYSSFSSAKCCWSFVTSLDAAQTNIVEVTVSGYTAHHCKTTIKLRRKWLSILLRLLTHDEALLMLIAAGSNQHFLQYFFNSVKKNANWKMTNWQSSKQSDGIVSQKSKRWNYNPFHILLMV